MNVHGIALSQVLKMLDPKPSDSECFKLIKSNGESEIMTLRQMREKLDFKKVKVSKIACWFSFEGEFLGLKFILK